MRRIRRHLSFANVVSVIALFVALGGGTAVALTGSNTVQSDDLGPGAQVKAADIAANAVNSANVVNGSITGADLAPSALPTGRGISSSCDPASEHFVDCGHVTLHLTRTSRVLIVATAMWDIANPPSGGTCRLAVNGAPFGPDAFPGQTVDASSIDHQSSVTLTAVTDANLGAGDHTFGLACNQTQDDIIRFDETYVSAVVLGPN